MNDRFVDRLDAQRTGALADALSQVAINKDHAMGADMPKLKFWRLEFDARYTMEVFGTFTPCLASFYLFDH